MVKTDGYPGNNGLRSIFCFWLLLFFIAVATTGCNEGQDSISNRFPCGKINPDVYSASTLELVRSVIIENNPELSEEEQRIILYSSPRISEYLMGTDYGEYFWEWGLAEGRKASAHYIGMLESIQKEDIKWIIEE